MQSLRHPPSPSRRWTRRLSFLARLALAGTWCWAGCAKLLDQRASVQAVRAFRVLPEPWVEPFAYGLPALEIGAAVLLLAGTGGRLGAVLSSALLVVFTIGIAQAWARGLSIDCGCFGGGGEVEPAEAHYPTELARDFGLLAVSLWLSLRRLPRAAAASGSF
ncbi:MauE/DoxX family redox-associated membrane protein [Streptomyces sp. NPDC048659]|uniref:MauE/DoxX family redox-associated membrane protein n=1 Tax=Streptomyces sp. NPDC048659 TaxID=3155489 RepID=UPI00341A6AD2